MKALAVTILLVASIAAQVSAQSVPASNPDVWLRFQDKLVTVSDYAVTMTMVSGGHSLTSRLWRLAPRTRMEFAVPNFGTVANIFDPEAANDQGGKGVSYMLFVENKCYRKTALPPAQGSTAKSDTDVKTEELGKETIQGLVCDKRRMTVTESSTKQAHVMLLWTSSFVRNMPVQFESTEQGVTTRLQFRDYNFDKPAASLFVVPADYVAMPGVPTMPGVPAMPGVAAPAPVAPPTAPSISVGSPLLNVTVQPNMSAPVITNRPATAADDVGEVAKEAAKSATQNAVQEGVNRGLKKAFGW